MSNNMARVGYAQIKSGVTTTLGVDPSYLSDLYDVEFSLVSGSPAAGTTAVTATPVNGTAETVYDAYGVALNIDPTALKGFSISSRVLSSLTFTPSAWTAGVVVGVSIFARIVR